MGSCSAAARKAVDELLARSGDDQAASLKALRQLTDDVVSKHRKTPAQEKNLVDQRKKFAADSDVPIPKLLADVSPKKELSADPSQRLRQVKRMRLSSLQLDLLRRVHERGGGDAAAVAVALEHDLECADAFGSDRLSRVVRRLYQQQQQNAEKGDVGSSSFEAFCLNFLND